MFRLREKIRKPYNELKTKHENLKKIQQISTLINHLINFIEQIKKLKTDQPIEKTSKLIKQLGIFFNINYFLFIF